MPLTQPNTMLQLLREITQAINASTDLSETLDVVVRRTDDALHVDSCSLYLLDPDGTTLRLLASTGLHPDVFGAATLRVGEGLTGSAVSRNMPIYAADAQNDPLFVRVPGAKEMIYQSLLAIPLLSGGVRVGAMNVQTLVAREFNAHDIASLELIGDLAAGAIARAQLVENQQRRLDDLQTVAKLSEAMTSPLYLDEMLKLVTESITRAMGVPVCSVFLLNDDKDGLDAYAADRTTLNYHNMPVVPLAGSVIGSVAQSGKSRYVPNVLNERDFYNQQMAKQAGIVSMQAVPLSVRDDCIGVMCVYTNERRKFTPKEVALLNTMANQTAMTLENSRLATNAAVVREMHHRIKNNLQSVAMLMRLQLREADKLSTEEVLRVNIDRIHSIAAVHEVLSEKGFRLVDVKDVLQRIARTTQQMTNPNHPVAIRVSGMSIEMRSKAATSLVLIVNELVQNAIEHGFGQHQGGTINISLGRNAKEHIIQVIDDGQGLPDTKTFRPNLGLQIAETLCEEDLQGSLTFKRLAIGTEAMIRIPKN